MTENRTRIKICGITNREDAHAAIEYGVDALGFIFVANTPRYVGSTPDLIALLGSIPPFISRVGVCIRPDDIVPDALRYLDVLQIYDHRQINAPGGPHRHVPAFRLKGPSDLEQISALIEAERPQAILLDAYHELSLGGAGVVFDWGLAREAKHRYGVRIILAGGLTPDNVAEAILQVQPYAVDVSSGVESSQPGRKDHGRLRAFIDAVRSAT